MLAGAPPSPTHHTCSHSTLGFPCDPAPVMTSSFLTPAPAKVGPGGVFSLSHPLCQAQGLAHRKLYRDFTG